jgi:hypothetical protein
VIQLTDAAFSLSLAGLGAFVLGRAAQWYFERRRRRGFLAESDWRKHPLLSSLPAWTTPVSDEVLSRFENAKSGIRALHADAVAQQEAYGRRSVYTVSMAFYAFIGAASGRLLGETGLAIQTLGLAGTVFFYLRARHSRERWIAARTMAELARQSSTLEGILVPLESHVSGVVVPSDTGSTAAAFAKLRDLDVTPDACLEIAIATWADIRRRVRAAVLTGPLYPEQLVLYLQRRAIRQLSWFSNAGERMTSREGNRRRVLHILFVGILLLAVLDGLCLLNEASDKSRELLALAGVLLTAASGGVAAFYAGQNQRSLLHIYSAQRRLIEHWTRYVIAINRTTLSLTEPRPFQPSETATLVDSILEFEDSLAEELHAWISVTEHDSIELGG